MFSLPCATPLLPPIDQSPSLPVAAFPSSFSIIMLILPYHINTIENRRETIPVVFKNQPYDPVQCSVVFRYPFFYFSIFLSFFFFLPSPSLLLFLSLFYSFFFFSLFFYLFVTKKRPPPSIPSYSNTMTVLVLN